MPCTSPFSGSWKSPPKSPQPKSGERFVFEVRVLGTASPGTTSTAPVTFQTSFGQEDFDAAKVLTMSSQRTMADSAESTANQGSIWKTDDAPQWRMVPEQSDTQLRCTTEITASIPPRYHPATGNLLLHPEPDSWSAVTAMKDTEGWVSIKNGSVRTILPDDVKNDQPLTFDLFSFKVTPSEQRFRPRGRLHVPLFRPSGIRFWKPDMTVHYRLVVSRVESSLKDTGAGTDIPETSVE